MDQISRIIIIEVIFYFLQNGVVGDFKSVMTTSNILPLPGLLNDTFVSEAEGDPAVLMGIQNGQHNTQDKKNSAGNNSSSVNLEQHKSVPKKGVALSEGFSSASGLGVAVSKHDNTTSVPKKGVPVEQEHEQSSSFSSNFDHKTGMYNMHANNSIEPLQKVDNALDMKPLNSTDEVHHKPAFALGTDNGKVIELNVKHFEASSESEIAPDRYVPIISSLIVGIGFLSVLLYLAVKKGKEKWERRSYNRMNYLIDGIYDN